MSCDFSHSFHLNKYAPFAIPPLQTSAYTLHYLMSTAGVHKCSRCYPWFYIKINDSAFAVMKVIHACIKSPHFIGNVMWRKGN